MPRAYIPSPAVIAPRRAATTDFMTRTDPVVLSAMRGLAHGCHSPRCPHLPPAERAALDAWLAPRLEALIDRLVETRLRGSRGWPPNATTLWPKRDQAHLARDFTYHRSASRGKRGAA